MSVPATLTVNGTSYPVELDPHVSLLDAVRDAVGLTGSKEGCDDSECGACMMLLDGKPVNSCCYLALQAEGREVTTVEGLADGDELAPLQRAFLEHVGVQCGFCTPGMLISATALLRANPIRPRTRCVSRSPATSAGAPATAASWKPSGASRRRRSRLAAEARAYALPHAPSRRVRVPSADRGRPTSPARRTGLRFGDGQRSRSLDASSPDANASTRVASRRHRRDRGGHPLGRHRGGSGLGPAEGVMHLEGIAHVGERQATIESGGWSPASGAAWIDGPTEHETDGPLGRSDRETSR